MSKTIPSQDLKRQKAQRDARLRIDPTCRRCGQTKTVADFGKNRVDYSCKVCDRKYAIAAYRKQRDAMSPAELQTHRDKINSRQNARRAAKLAAMTPEELAAHRLETNARLKAARDRVRDRVYEAYGGYICNCCGEPERMFLSIDHVNNDGAAHRREHGHITGEQMYRWLIRNKFPPGFQVLCMNCQWGKRNNNGVCPHKLRYGVTTIPEGSRAKRPEAQRARLVCDG